MQSKTESHVWTIALSWKVSNLGAWEHDNKIKSHTSSRTRNAQSLRASEGAEHHCARGHDCGRSASTHWMGGTRKDGLLSTFPFHVFELLPCKSQFAKKHDKIMVGPAESARLCYAKLIPAVNHVHSPNTKAGCTALQTHYLLLPKMIKCLSDLFSLYYLCIELSSL